MSLIIWGADCGDVLENLGFCSNQNEHSCSLNNSAVYLQFVQMQMTSWVQEGKAKFQTLLRIFLPFVFPVNSLCWRSAPRLCTSASPLLLPAHTYWRPVKMACTASTHNLVLTTPLRSKGIFSFNLTTLCSYLSYMVTNSIYLFIYLFFLSRQMDMEVTFPIYKKEDKDHDYHTIDGLSFLTDDIVGMWGSCSILQWFYSQYVLFTVMGPHSGFSRDTMWLWGWKDCSVSPPLCYSSYLKFFMFTCIFWT